MKIPLSKILFDQSLNASREPFELESCRGLSQTIERKGLIQPVLVGRIEHEVFDYQLIFGFRRYGAHLLLGWEDIESNVTEEPPELWPLLNAIENLDRQDLSFWEECLALKNCFPSEAKQVDIAEALGKSRGWVQKRWRIWQLPEETLAYFRSGEWGAEEAGLLIQQSPEEQIAAAEALRLGQSTEEVARRVTNRRPPRKKADLQRMASRMMELGRLSEMHVLRWALGEIDDNQLLESMEKRQ